MDLSLSSNVLARTIRMQAMLDLSLLLCNLRDQFFVEDDNPRRERTRSNISRGNESMFVTCAMTKNPASVNCEQRVASSFLQENKVEAQQSASMVAGNRTSTDESISPAISRHCPLDCYNWQWSRFPAEGNVQSTSWTLRQSTTKRTIHVRFLCLHVWVSLPSIDWDRERIFSDRILPEHLQHYSSSTWLVQQSDRHVFTVAYMSTSFSFEYIQLGTCFGETLNSILCYVHTPGYIDPFEIRTMCTFNGNSSLTLLANEQRD